MANPILTRDGQPITYTRDKYVPTGFNSDLAHEVLDVIRAFPANHNQDAWCSPGSTEVCEKDAREEFIEDPIETAWSCGTGMCFAGWAVALSVGLDWDERDPSRPWADPGVVGGVEPGENGRIWGSSIGEAARQLLGITYGDAYKLFKADNTLDDLERLVDRLEQKYGAA